MALWGLRIMGWLLIIVGILFAEFVPIVALANWWHGTPQLNVKSNLILFGFFVAVALVGYVLTWFTRGSGSHHKRVVASKPKPPPLAKSDKLRRWQQRA